MKENEKAVSKVLEKLWLASIDVDGECDLVRAAWYINDFDMGVDYYPFVPESQVSALQADVGERLKRREYESYAACLRFAEILTKEEFIEYLRKVITQDKNIYPPTTKEALTPVAPSNAEENEPLGNPEELEKQ